LKGIKEMKLYWKVSDIPTGPYRSFETRDWPTAYFDKEMCLPAAHIYCDDEYKPSRIKTGNHAELRVRVTDWSVIGQGFKWKTMAMRFKTLEEAKFGGGKFFDYHPEFLPTELKDIKVVINTEGVLHEKGKVNGKRILKKLAEKKLEILV
jgi:hypothetical protein